MEYNIETTPFYYNYVTAQERSYVDYLHNIAMVKDIDNSIKCNTDKSIAANAFFTEKINSSIIDAQIASTDALYNNMQELYGVLYSGFSGISRQIGSMHVSMSMAFASLNSAVQESANAICDRLDTMNDILNNPFLTKSRELYRRASVSYDKGFYEEARDDLLDAINSNRTDHISWFLLGKTYLFGTSEFSTVIDLDKSIEALKNAAKYIKPYARTSGEAQVLAAEICFYLGLSQQTKAMDILYVQNKAEYQNYLEQAKSSYSQAWDYSQEMLEARCNLARCKAILGDIQGAISDLEIVVLRDRTYCIKVYADSDFLPIEEQFTVLIKKLKKIAFIPAKQDYDYIHTLLSELASLEGTTEVSVPVTFTEETPYFDVLDYAEDFKRIIPIVEKDVVEKKAALVKAKQLEDERLERLAQLEREAKAKQLEEERIAKEKAEQLEKERLLRERLVKVRESIAKHQVYFYCNDWNYFDGKPLIKSIADKNIVAVDYNDILNTLVFLKADGTVVVLELKEDRNGNFEFSVCNYTNDWHDIIAVAAGTSYAVGLKEDGTVVIASDKGYQYNDWRDIVAVATGNPGTIGLKADGTVVATRDNSNINAWHNIVAVATGLFHTVGLKADGTVVTDGRSDSKYANKYGQCNVEHWRDIVAVAAGSYHTIGLKADGTVVAVGDNEDGQCNVNDWRNIVAVAIGSYCTFGLKTDGTGIAVGNNWRHNLRTWRVIGSVSKEQLFKWIQSLHYQAQGLCCYCGGKLGLFTKKCKSCGKKN